MSIPNSFTTLLRKHKKLLSGKVITEKSSILYFNDVSEYLAECNVPSYEIFATIQSFKLEPTPQKANSVLISLCLLMVSPTKIVALKDNIMSKTLKFPIALKLEELTALMASVKIEESADEPIVDLYKAFIGSNVDEIISCYNDVKGDEKCGKWFVKEAIIVRVFQLLAEQKNISIADIKKKLDFVPWFTVETTLLKRASSSELNVTIDLSSGIINIERIIEKKPESFEINQDIIEAEKKLIVEKTKAFNNKITSIEREKEKQRLAAEAKRREEEEDARLEREYLERKKKEEEDEKARKKEEMRKIKSDSAAEMQKLFKMQEKVRIKEEKDKQMKNLFERFFYHERARRMVEKNFTDKKVEEEAEEIKEMYRIVCESKEQMKRAEHDRKVALKNKFSNKGALQTWLESIGKGESEEEKQAKLEKARKEKEEAEKIIREKAEAERKAKLLEEERKREEEKKRKEEELFKKNQQKIENQSATDVYQPKHSQKYVEDSEGWVGSKRDQKYSTSQTKASSGVPSFSSKPSNPSQGAYQPPRSQPSSGVPSFSSKSSSGVPSFSSKPSSGVPSFSSKPSNPSQGAYQAPRSQPSSGVPSFSSKSSGVPSFSSTKRGGKK